MVFGTPATLGPESNASEGEPTRSRIGLVRPATLGPESNVPAAVVGETLDLEPEPRAGIARQTIELLVALGLCILIVRAFVAEAYVVPTGSMTPALLGRHRELVCQSCGTTFAVGLDEADGSARGICPRCGEREGPTTPSRVRGGDRVLVQKFFHEFQPPRRWEVAVFRFPDDHSQAYVKRVVGLPGESIRIVDGDVEINGRIARKALEDFRALRILVHDSEGSGRDSPLAPRWSPRPPGAPATVSSGWTTREGRHVHELLSRSRLGVDWLVYEHWDPVRNRPGPIRDFYAYDGEEGRVENEVRDLGLEAEVAVDRSVDFLAIRLRSGARRFEIHLPVERAGDAELLQDGRPTRTTPLEPPFQADGPWPRHALVSASVVDHRVQVAVDGRLVFVPFDYEPSQSEPSGGDSPIALGVSGPGEVVVDRLRVYRDIFYTSYLADAPLAARGVGQPVVLGPNEYFMLGDNSPVSCDSRFWNSGPVVSRELLLGKPFLVHLPGDLAPIHILGRLVCWVPDPRRIRYIH